MSEHREGIPDKYYDSPYLPSSVEMEDWGELHLDVIDAHTLFLNAIGKENPDSPTMRALKEIIDNDTPGDLVQIRKQIMEDYDD